MATVEEMLFGGEKEYHRDGSVTERFSDGQSITRDSNGKILEYSRPEELSPIPIGPLSRQAQITRDGDGNIINAQWLKK